MRPNSKKIATVVILAGVLLVALAGSVFAAPPWSDAPNAWWVSSYDVTAAEVATVADGYPDGTFRPANAVTRGQFAKMAVNGLGLNPLDPPNPSFLDVPASHIFYTFVEGAVIEGVINGYADDTFRPDNLISRQQANSMMGRFLSEKELDAKRKIKGDVLSYSTLEAWYNAEGTFYLSSYTYTDAGQIADVHRPTTAYLVRYGVVLGSGFKLNPLASLSRAQAVTMVLRTLDAVEEVAPSTPPPAPTDVHTFPSSPSSDTRPFVMGGTIPEGWVAIYDNFGGTNTQIATSFANKAGEFSIRVPVLAEGVHSFTARVRNIHGLISVPSAAFSYRVDTTAPQGEITQPENGGAVRYRKPAFNVTATDVGTGVDHVMFQYAADDGMPNYVTISTDMVAPFQATWSDISLPDGAFLFRAIVSDTAGNQAVLGPIGVTVDLRAPTVALLAPVDECGIFFTNSRTPLFAADAADLPAAGATVASGVAQVDFLYAVFADLPIEPNDWTSADFTLLSSDDSPGYAADWTGTELADGHYVFAVQSVDRAGNPSALDTQEVVIDNVAPVLAIVAPVAEEHVMGGATYTIRWTAVDAYFPLNPIKIEYSDDAGAGWTVLTAGTPNDGEFDWSVPTLGADGPDYMIRITATDGWGPVTQATVAFAVDVTPPEAPTSVEAQDNDETEIGVNGLDLTVTWTKSVATDVAEQRIYVLPDGTALELTGATPHVPAVVLAGNTVDTWTGTAALTADGAGTLFAPGLPYDVYVVAVDGAGHLTTSVAGAWNPTSP